MEKKGIAIACRMDSEKAIKLARRIFDFLRKNKGEEVFLETRIAPRIMPHGGKDLITMTAENTKFVISIGGDGTVLRVTSGLSQRDPPPVLGVNLGSIGFLDESNERTVFKDINRILNGDYTIEKCSKITPFLVKNSEEIRLSNALNEVLIVSSKNSKVLQISIKINGVFLNRSYLDGVIISTPTGSTAYNLSAGGAILNPNLTVMQIVPLNPFARSGLKPLVIPIESEVEVELLRPRLNAKILIDGQQTIKNVQPFSKIRVRKADSVTKFIRFSRMIDESYYRRLRKKIIGNLRIPMDDSPEE